jgi:hypothetical protein
METFAELTRKAEAILDAPNATRATELVAELLTFLPSRQKLAEALKMGNRVRVRELERGLTSSKRTPTQKRYDAFFAAAEVFLERCRAGEVPQASATDKTEKVTEESADPESPPTKASTPARAKSLEIELTDGPTLAEVLAAFGGGPSPFGTNFALTSDVFREIDGDPGALGVEVARAAMRYARALLNIMTQVKDPKVRERVRKELGPEVEEMFHTLKLFSNENPTRLLPLYDAQRTTLAATTGNGGKAKKKRRR